MPFFQSGKFSRGMPIFCLRGMLARCFSVSFSFTIALRGYRSLLASTTLITLISCDYLLNFLLIITWFIWFIVMSSWDFHLSLWISRCWKMVPLMTKLKLRQKSTSSPISFPRHYMTKILPIRRKTENNQFNFITNPCFPMILFSIFISYFGIHIPCYED